MHREPPYVALVATVLYDQSFRCDHESFMQGVGDIGRAVANVKIQKSYEYEVQQFDCR